MTGPAKPGGGNKRRFADYLRMDHLYALGLTLSAFIFGILLGDFLAEGHAGAGAGDQASEARLRGHKDEYKRELRLYLLGLGLALVLTLVPFGLVNWSMLSSLGLFVAIGVFAFAQIVVHFRCFLHIDPPRQNMDDLHLILFSGLLLFFMVAGTIWIMSNLAMRM